METGADSRETRWLRHHARNSGARPSWYLPVHLAQGAECVARCSGGCNTPAGQERSPLKGALPPGGTAPGRGGPIRGTGAVPLPGPGRRRRVKPSAWRCSMSIERCCTCTGTSLPSGGSSRQQQGPLEIDGWRQASAERRVASLVVIADLEPSERASGAWQPIGLADAGVIEALAVGHGRVHYRKSPVRIDLFRAEPDRRTRRIRWWLGPGGGAWVSR